MLHIPTAVERNKLRLLNVTSNVTSPHRVHTTSSHCQGKKNEFIQTYGASFVSLGELIDRGVAISDYTALRDASLVRGVTPSPPTPGSSWVKIAPVFQSKRNVKSLRLASIRRSSSQGCSRWPKLDCDVSDTADAMDPGALVNRNLPRDRAWKK